MGRANRINVCGWLYNKTNQSKGQRMNDFLDNLDRISAEQFFEWFDEAQALADKHEVRLEQIYNVRQVWDYAFSCGALAYAKQKAGK
jgi:hypothetical protein